MTGAEAFLGLGLASVAAGSAGKVVAGLSAANESDYLAEMTRQQAERERALAAREAADHRRTQSRIAAGARAGRAASGLAGAGSALLVEEDIAGATELGALDILNNGLVASARLEQEARLQRMQAQSQRVAGVFKGAGSLLSGAAGTYGIYRDL